MKAQEAASLLACGEAIALDVREPDEWNAGRIAGALHIPMGELAQRQHELLRDRTIVAVCRRGNRSRMVTKALRRAGYEAENLDGGLKGWQRADLPLEPAGGRVV
jgi:rhodanese-related sulfurtransferase